MSFSFDVRIFPHTAEKLKNAFKFGQFYLDNAVIKDSNYYAPMDQHFLEKSVLIHSDIGSGRVVWQMPYARKLYYNPRYDFSTDVNPNARGFWFENAKAQAKEQWLKEADLAVKSKL